MKAAVIVEAGKIGLRERPLPSVPEGWIRIKVMATGICGSDFFLVQNIRPGVDLIGQTLGHEVSGIVDHVGKAVDGVRVGDRVAVEPIIECGQCVHCREGKYHLCKNLSHLGVHYPGGFAEYLSIPARKAVRIPDSLSFPEATQLDGTAVAVHAVHLLGKRQGDTVAILGDGFIGLVTGQVAHLLQPEKIIVIGKHDHNLSLASRLGATHTINISKVDPVEAVRGITKGKGVSLVFESVGRRSSTLELAPKIAAKEAVIVVIGVFHHPQPVGLRDLVVKELRILGSFCYSHWEKRLEYKDALHLVTQGSVKITPLITHKLSLDEVEKAFAIASQKEKYQSIKVILLPTGE